MTRFPNHEICFQNSQCVVSRQHVGLYVESKLHGYVDSRFACFYLTGQLESKLRKFQLAEVVLVVSKPHVFNLTGQLVSTPPVFPTLAATDLSLYLCAAPFFVSYVPLSEFRVGLLVGELVGEGFVGYK